MLAKLFGSKVRAKVIGWLFTHTEKRYFVRQLESIIDEDKTNISRELARLADMGLLITTTEGRQKYYQANLECPVYEELRGLAVKTIGYVEVLEEELGPFRERIEVAFIFGSLAESRDSSFSDVDVIVIGDVTFKEMVAAVRPAQDRLAREVNPSVYPVEEFRRKVADGNHFLNSLLKTNKLFLIGDRIAFEALVEERVVD